jgi:hypothetical protein
MPEAHPLEDLFFGQDRPDLLCRERPLEFREYAPMNEFHGGAAMLKRYAALPFHEPLPFAVEHAIPFDLAEAYDYDLGSGLSTFLAVHARSAGLYRAGGLMRALPVGSTYLYALSLFRDSYGKRAPAPRQGTLVFPDKSTLLMETDFDRRGFARRLVDLPKEFHPVVVCIYWRDYARGQHQPFVEAGLPVVSAGHLLDPDFLFRLHDLCRRFRYACANDLAGSFIYSVLSGCRFFHLEAGPLVQRKHGVVSRFEQDPTLAKPIKRACLAASPFPPGEGDDQRRLAFFQAGGPHRVRPDEMAALYTLAREALTRHFRPGRLEFAGALDRPLFHSLLPRGIDQDGWCAEVASLTVPGGARVAAIRLDVQIHLEDYCQFQGIEIRVNQCPITLVTTPLPRHQVILPLPPSPGPVAVEFRASSAFALGSDARRRAFRLVSVEWAMA